MTQILTTLFLIIGVFNDQKCDALNCEGCVALDELSFDKVLSKFPVSLIKFDIAYPYGDRHDQFAQVAKDAANIPDLFVGEVGIKDYGEKENSELGKRFKIERDDFPAVLVFVKNNLKGSIEHFKFDNDKGFNAGNLKNFIKQKSGLRIPLKGCIEQLDNIAEKFTSTSSEEERKILRKDAEQEIKSLPEDQKKNGQMYTKVMKKLTSDGEGFLSSEETRIKKLLTTKLTAKKKEEMEIRLNILTSFMVTSVDAANGKDEL